MGMVKLQGVKVGRHFVYFHTAEGKLSLGPAGKMRDAVKFIQDVPDDKGTRRKIRKALHAAGRADLAAKSVPAKTKTIAEQYKDIPY